MATLTKSTGTVTLSGAVEKVALPAVYGWVWVKNMSDADMFVGLFDGISAGADGVLAIPAGECGRVQTDGQDSVYLLGSGNALVVAQNYADCPFKVGGKGGDSPDLSAYAKKSDIQNENLLMNPDFEINQRGLSTKTIGEPAEYFIDRWTGERCVVTKNSSGGIDFSWNGTDGTYGNIKQRLENSKNLIGKNVTISADIDGVRMNTSFTLPSEINKATSLIYITDSIGAWMGIDSNSQVYVALSSKSTTVANIDNVKLEIGDTATPFVPPDPATELMKCQRYCIVLPSTRYSRATYVGTNTLIFFLSLPTAMRCVPSIESGEVYIIDVAKPYAEQVDKSYSITINSSSPVSTGNLNFTAKNASATASIDSCLYVTKNLVLSADL